MPNYTNNALATLLRENQQMYFWNNELVTAPQLSIAFELARVNRASYPWGLSVEVVFSAAPGAFEIDIMGANLDNIGNYNSLGTITAVNASNVGRFDITQNFWPKYVAGYLKTLTNSAAKISLQVTR